jgi:Xaa-Pro aminopeptidase
MTQALLLVGDSYSNQNIFYKTRFLASDAFLYVEKDGEGVLVVSTMELGRAEKESTVATVRDFDEYGYREMARELNDRHRAFTTVMTRVVRDTGVDQVLVGREFPALYADGLRAEGIEVEIDPRLLSAQRRQKSRQEIECIEAAQRATERATARAFDILARSEDRQGVLHLDGIPLTAERLRSEIEISLVRAGMDTSQQPIIAGGPGAADPHWKGTGSLKAGEAIVFDVFPRGMDSRYFADMSRTVVKGVPSDQLRAMYGAVLYAQEAALATIRAGVNGRDVHAAVLEAFRERGFSEDGAGARFTHGTGHGVGLDIHEAPYLGALDVELLEGEVVTVEPGLYDDKVGAVRLEDLVVVTRDGCRNLTQFPKQFQV